MQLPHATHFSRSMCMPPRLLAAVPAWPRGAGAPRDCAAANAAVSADDVRKSLRFIAWEVDLIPAGISVLAVPTNTDCMLTRPPLETSVPFPPTRATRATQEKAPSARSGYEEEQGCRWNAAAARKTTVPPGRQAKKGKAATSSRPCTMSLRRTFPAEEPGVRAAARLVDSWCKNDWHARRRSRNAAHT